MPADGTTAVHCDERKYRHIPLEGQLLVKIHPLHVHAEERRAIRDERCVEP
jgi:hypothetical protein